MTTKNKIVRTIQGLAKLTKDGAEVCDPKPKVLSTGIKRPPTQEERLMRILRTHREQMAHDQEYSDETDFDIDEEDMLTPYEKQAHVFDTVPVVPEEVSERVKDETLDPPPEKKEPTEDANSESSTE